MKNSWLRYAAGAVIAGGMLFAAGQSGSQPVPPSQPAVHQHQRGARLARYLNLSPAQIAQAKAEFQGVRQQAQPIRQQLQQVHAAMFQAIRANDTAKIDQLSAQEAGMKGQISAMRHQAMAQLYASLTPEQRAKADQLPAHMRQMRQHRMQNQPNPNNG